MLLAVFAAAFLFRFMRPNFDNDHYRILSQARQVLVHGEVPIRDFLDPGMFLLIYTTAAVQAVFGYNLFGEALFSSGALALGAALTFYLARRLSGSLPLALIATAVAVVLHPRLYQYRVVLPPLLGILLCWRYVDRPTAGRLVALALVTAVAFLLRHDQGVYLAAASGVTLALIHWRDGLAVLARRLGLYLGLAALPVVPFLLFLELNGGTLHYFRLAGEYVRSEAARGRVLQRPPFKVDAAQPLVVLAQQPRALARVKVEWSSRVTADLREQLERRYALSGGAPEAGGRNGSVWTYGLLDDSRPNLTALLADERVINTGGIDRTTARPKQPLDTTALAELKRVARSLLAAEYLPGIVNHSNAVAWLFHLYLLVPVAALVVLISRRRAGEPALVPRVVALAVLCLIAQRALVRDPLGARLADAAAPTAILGAWLLALLVPRRPTGNEASVGGRPWRCWANRAALLVVFGLVGATMISVSLVGRLASHLEAAGLADGPGAVGPNFTRTLTRLRTSPPINAPDGISRGRQSLARYVRACTAPTDRLLVTWFAPEFYFYSERGFAAGQLFWFDRYHDSPADQRRSIEILRRQQVPIIIDRTERSNSIRAFEEIARHVEENYALVFEGALAERDTLYRVLVHRQAVPVGVDRQLGLPCFRA